MKLPTLPLDFELSRVESSLMVFSKIARAAPHGEEAENRKELYYYYPLIRANMLVTRACTTEM